MKPFRFKEFTVHQKKAAMKIGTDAVLLGAWCSLDTYPDTILDIGAGTGVISLMLAQRSDAETIDAVEIDEAAYEEAVANFEQSDWGDRLFCYHASFEEFANEIEEEEETYDLIVSNPPFFRGSHSDTDAARNTARNTDALPFEALIRHTREILATKGTFAVIIPFEEETHFIALAQEYNLYLNRVCHVQGTPSSKIRRSLLEFSFVETAVKEETLVIEVARHQYTDAYKALTNDFYL